MAAWATFLMTALLAASQVRAGECRTMQLNPAPPIFNTPMFDEAGDNLLLVDILAASIDVYSLTGDLQRTIKKPGFSKPNTIASTPSGSLLRDGGDRFVRERPRTWFLAEYDRAKQKTVAILELPTSADHVEIAAGKKWLAVIGNGRFLPDERFTPDNVTLIPMSALRALHAAGGSIESPRKPATR